MYVVEDWDALARGVKVKALPVQGTEYAELVEYIPRPVDSYGDYNQDERECYIIFKVGDRYFRKTGETSSYGDETTWHGTPVEVFPKTKTVTYYE